MPGLAIGNLLGNGLLLKNGVNYLETPYNSLYNFSVTQNFTITWTGILQTPSSVNNTPRYTLATRRRGGTGAANISYELLVSPAQNGNATQAMLIIWDNKTPTATANSLNANFILPDWAFGNLVTITFSKFNANPLASITSNEWKGYLNGVPQPMIFGNIGSFNASTVITDNTSTLKINTNGLLDPLSRSGIVLYDFAITDLLTDKEIYFIGLNDGLFPASAKSKRVVHYDFEQKTGTAVFDKSGNNLNGVLYGTSTTSPGPLNQWVNNNQESILI